MKIGFFMGSFDPIHIGHVNIIRLALNSGELDKVIIVPSGHNPWKKEAPAPFDDRVEMCIASTLEFGKACEVSSIEKTFEPPFYSNKPLNYFREKYKDDELFILCGQDTTNKIPHWRNAKEDILPFYGIIEIKRPGCTEVTHPTKAIDGPIIEISSTEVRQCIREGKFLSPLLIPTAIDIIKTKSLYLTQS